MFQEKAVFHVKIDFGLHYLVLKSVKYLMEQSVRVLKLIWQLLWKLI